MRKKTIILLVVFIIYIALCNYGIYIHRIKYEYWEVKDLIFFLGILNGVIITLPLGAYFSYITYKEDKERKKLAILLVKNMIDKHQEEKEELQDKINELKRESEEVMITTYPKVEDKEKVSVTLIDQLNGIRNNIEDTRSLVRLLDEFLSGNNKNLFKEYEALNETIALRLDSIKEELEDLTNNHLEVKK